MPDPTPSSRQLLGFAAAVVFLTALNFIRQLPEVHSLDAFVFGDPGFALSVDAMLDEGREPTEDFAYFYGLLGVVIDRVWFAGIGRTAFADTALLALCNLLLALGLVRFARAIDLPRSVWWLLLAGVPVAIMPMRYTSPTHAIDAALLVHALAFQARGNRRAAFVLVVIGVLVKSALASVYATGLLGLILLGPRQEPTGWRQRARELIPGAVVGLVLTGLLMVRFGWGPVVCTLFPIAGAKTYAGERFGFFFGIGRQFWLRTPFDPVYYLFGPAGFWLLASAVMLTGVPQLIQARRDPRAQAILTVAALHLAFVFFLFGHDLSWLYYSFLPVLGACGVVGQWEAAGTCPRWLRVGLPVIVVCGCVGFAVHGWTIWKDTICTEATGGLFARPADAEAWGRVRGLGRHERVLVFTPSGAGRVLFPEVDSIRSSALLPAVATPTEVNALLARLWTADAVVVHPVTRPMFDHWPPFKDELEAFEDDPQTTGDAMFQVLRRKGAHHPVRPGGGVERPPGGE